MSVFYTPQRQSVTSERFCVAGHFCVGHAWILVLAVVCTAAPKCMELLPCELVIARYNDCAHQVLYTRIGRIAAVLVGVLLS